MESLQEVDEVPRNSSNPPSTDLLISTFPYDRQWIILKSYVIPSKPHRDVVDVAVDDERWRPGPNVLWDANAADQLLHPKYHDLVEDDFQADATTKNDDDSMVNTKMLHCSLVPTLTDGCMPPISSRRRRVNVPDRSSHFICRSR